MIRDCIRDYTKVQEGPPMSIINGSFNKASVDSSSFEVSRVLGASGFVRFPLIWKVWLPVMLWFGP